jgi:DNA-binding LacI/PurR family transcriptional regulator
MVTSEQVAQLAGVSRATVSRVLNGSANVSEETRKRIYAAIATLGYGANAFTRTPVQEQLNVIALALFGSNDGLSFSRITDTQCYFYLEVLRFLEQEVAKAGYDLLLPSNPYRTFSAVDDPETNYILALQTKRVKGVITMALRSDDPRIQGLCRSTIPAVFIDSDFQGQHTTYVRSDYMGGSRLATEHLLSLGHRRIACFIGDTNVVSGTERLLGFQQTMARAGLIVDPQLVVQPGWETGEAYQAAMKLLSQRRDFTAIFASSDMMAFGVMQALRAYNIRVPEEMSIVGFDDIRQSEESDPPLTTLRQDKQAISLGAVERLTQLIRGDERPEPLIIPTRLIVRASTAPAPHD